MPGPDASFNMRVDAAPELEAPIVFVGYGLTVPELDYDDLAGLDLHGKVALLVTGGPSHIPGPLLSHYQSVRWSILEETGAVGVLSISIRARWRSRGSARCSRACCRR